MSNISFSINVSEIDKEKLVPGKKGSYLNMVAIPTPGNKYGNDYMIVQGVTKEEREAGIQGAVLGNGKVFSKQGGASKPAAVAAESDVPF